jgi:hypothetical protein
MAFAALDVALIFGTWRATRFAVFGALLTATVQLAAMLGDIIAGEPAGLPVSVFRNYLLADTAYLGLLITQGFIMAIAIGIWALPTCARSLASVVEDIQEVSQETGSQVPL